MFYLQWIAEVSLIILYRLKPAKIKPLRLKIRLKSGRKHIHHHLQAGDVFTTSPACGLTQPAQPRLSSHKVKLLLKRTAIQPQNVSQIFGASFAYFYPPHKFYSFVSIIKGNAVEELLPPRSDCLILVYHLLSSYATKPFSFPLS